MRSNDGLVFQLLRLWLQRRQGRSPPSNGVFGRPVRGLRLRRRRSPWRSLLRLVLIAIALGLIVRACHTRDAEDVRPATTRATWL